MKKTILILVANPHGSDSLDLLPEVHKLKEALKRANCKDQFDIKQEEALQKKDLRRHILEHNPQIIHYCGHGTKEGLIIHDENHQAQLLDNEFLVNLLENFADCVECLVLNACDTEPLAIEVVKHLNYAIGMNRVVKDQSAIAFAEAFYDAIGAGKEIEKAFELGKNAVLGTTSGGNQSRKLIAVREDDSPVTTQNQQYLIPVLYKKQHLSPISFPSNQSYIQNLSNFDFEFITINNYGEVISKQVRQAKYFTESLGEGVKLEMVLIPDGHFIMGASDAIEKNENPPHKVFIQPFFLGKHQVTQAQWKAVSLRSKISCELNPDPSHFKGDNRPVENITWYEAVEFCQRLSKYAGHEYRLPTEAEWEYACRAGTNTLFNCGETLVSELANFLSSQSYKTLEKGKYVGKTTNVMNFPSNAFGLYDMHGNIREWCFDCWHDNYQGAPSDGKAWVRNGNNLFRAC